MTLEIIFYLLAMIIVVPVSKKLGLGAVLGYLVAGIILGPSATSLISTHDQAAHVAEFGVIMMLLMIGLELNPKLLWKMRGPIFGLGGVQVALTTAVFAGIAYASGVRWQGAVAIGMVLSVSSTAIVLQTLEERGFAKSIGGERAFAILLFQDIAVIPMLALFPLLGTGVAAAPAARPGWLQAVIVLGAVVLLIGTGRYAVRPAFRVLARMKLRETFTAMALLLVVGTTALMQMVGLSPALGAFVAGVVLADSEFRHQIEADLEPFKGLLLGLFFISIGAGIDLALPVTKPLAVFGTVACLVAVKGVLIVVIGRAFRIAWTHAVLLGASLAQGGEFAFVLLGHATSLGILPEETAHLLTAAVAISMALAPPLIALTIRYVLPRLTTRAAEREADHIEDRDAPVVCVGIGRFGQVVVRLLKANGIRATVLDYDAEQIEVMERFGIKSYFGDATRPDVLRAAGLERAKILVLALDDRESALKIAKQVKMDFPHLKLYARAFDRVHAYNLYNEGVDEALIETGWTAVRLGASVLRGMGFSSFRAHRQGMIFGKYNERSIRELAPVFKNEERAVFVAQSRQKLTMLETLLQNEAGLTQVDSDRAWDDAR